MSAATVPNTKHLRLADANELIKTIASCGRQFFRHEDRVAKFAMNDGRLYLIEEWHGEPILISKRTRWRSFHHGGTLQRLVRDLGDFIRLGKPVPAHQFGPWPPWICGGDLWGYGDEAMALVRADAARLGITRTEVTS